MENMTQMIEDDDNIRLNYDDQDENQPTGILNVKQTVTIKKDCPTRWKSLLIMFNCLIKNR